MAQIDQQKMRSGRAIKLVLVLVLTVIEILHGQPNAVVVRGGWIFDAVREGVVRNTGIMIRGGKFMEVGAELTDRDLSDFRIVELAEDDYILPGIFDLHAHYNVNLFGRKRRDEVAANPVIFLANGVTSTFPAGEYDPDDMLELRKAINRKDKIGPRLFNSGAYFGSVRPGWRDDLPQEEIYKQVDYWAERGARGFKAKGIGPDQLEVLIERAHFHGLTVTGHLDSGYRNSVNPRDAILMGIDRIEHFLGGDALTPDKSAYASLVNVEPDTPEFERIVDLFLEHQVFFDATLTAYGYYGKGLPGYEHWTEKRRTS